jgi:glycerol-3-phosphate dehydrogenase (NAD(P)+)
VTLAAADAGLAADLADALQGPHFRLYDSDDPRGVEIGGAAKNVLAIACGVASGLGVGASASAALLARGFAELSRFGAAYGGRPATLMGLSGLGDLVLTCASAQSRNFAFGFDLGRGASPAEAGGGKLAEGAFTAPALTRLARAAGVDMPIAETVEAVLEGRIGARDAVQVLLSRPRKRE